jgi:predicted amidohydrolase YtcJ
MLFTNRPRAWSADDADLILHTGKIVTADESFTIADAVAVKDGRILAVGDNGTVLESRGDSTEVVDLDGKMVLPGLIDSHVHAIGASMTEQDHPIPDMESIQDVLDYIRSRAAVVPKGEWIVVRQVFITRLREQRYPTKTELDAAAPEHPVAFSTGPDASVNSLALERSGIDKNFRPTGAGLIERDPQTGEPNGILRSASRYLKIDEPEPNVGREERDERLVTLLKDYNRVGITAAIDRSASTSAVEQYHRLHAAGRLTVRFGLSHSIDAAADTAVVTNDIRRIAAHPLRSGSDMLRIIGVKAFLDGGMLTGSAYMRSPWGVSRIYGIDDPQYRGLKYIEHDKLVTLVRACVENDLQFTAHSVGDGAVHALLDAYEEVSRTTPVSKSRCCITHSNFMSRDAIEQAARLGVVLDIQPAWLYLDARTLTAQFGYDRLRYFQPLKTIFEQGAIAGGGSDHMQKVGSLRSINPYNPFLGMWVTLSRKARWYDGQLHPEETLSREQAVWFYTRNNAYIMRLEDQIGSLERGKLADFIILDRDLMTCPIDDVRDTQVLATYIGGRPVYQP